MLFHSSRGAVRETTAYFPFTSVVLHLFDSKACLCPRKYLKILLSKLIFTSISIIILEIEIKVFLL